MIKHLGYQERVIKVRSITLAVLKLEISRYYLKHPDATVQMLCITNGDSMTFHSISDVLECEWRDNAEIEIINLPFIWGDTEESKVIVIFQLDENECDKIFR